MDRTIGKSENRNNDGERLMISLLEIAQSINEVDDDKIIKYKDKDGESQEMTAGAAKKMDKDHPAKLAWDKMSGQEKGGDDSEKDAGGKLGGGDFDRDANRAADDEADDMDRDARFAADAEDDNAESDDVEISAANSGPIDRDDIMDMLKNDSEIMDKIGTGDDDDLYLDGMDLVSSKFNDDTIASIPNNADMTLGDLKKQIMDYEEEKFDPKSDGPYQGGSHFDRNDMEVESSSELDDFVDEYKEKLNDEQIKKLKDIRKKIEAAEEEYKDDPGSLRDEITQYWGEIEDIADSTRLEISINGKKYKPIKESKQHILKENYERFFGDKK